MYTTYVLKIHMYMCIHTTHTLRTHTTSRQMPKTYIVCPVEITCNGKAVRMDEKYTDIRHAKHAIFTAKDEIMVHMYADLCLYIYTYIYIYVCIYV